MNSKTKLPFDRDKIGRKFKVSGEHTVYLYNQDKVIKFPSGPIYLFSREDAFKKVSRDFKLVKKYFDKYLPSSKLHFYKNQEGKKKYCILQDFISSRPLEKKDLADPKIASQFEEITKINLKLEKEKGFSLEFFGIYSLLFHVFLNRMDNVVIAKDDRLFVTDVGLISKDHKITKSIVLNLIIRWAYWRQQKLIRGYQNYEADN
ncbi:MAG: hypothetical protein GF347_03820 [Candidatus Moranbacteria bacterium]|nr:hypothetical protein [Candidatus Moranbacteria bacterium]